MLTMTAHGRIGRDAELRETDRSSVLDIAIACNYGMKDKETGKTWTGHGKRPGWFVKATEGGTKAEEMAV